jgi:hypothetical protein
LVRLAKQGAWACEASIPVRVPIYPHANADRRLTGITLELSNSDEAQSSKTFTVNVTPVADDFLIMAKSVNLGAFGAAPLDLNIRLDGIAGNGIFSG